MAELKYLADHLRPEECRRLVAALHFKSYDQPNALDAAEGKISEDIPCLRLLLHWNSLEGEGRGETHELLFRRLRQIGRDDLADWLGKTVFHELGQELKHSLDDPFQEFTGDNSTREISAVVKPTSTNLQEQSAWLPLDTICWALILTLILSTTVILSRLIILHCKRNKKKTSKKQRKYGKYAKMENQQIVNSESESEDKFDIRKKDDPALKLMGV